MVVSLNRWEWNRALFFGLIVLIAEVGLATGLILRRLGRLEYDRRAASTPTVPAILRDDPAAVARPLRAGCRSRPRPDERVHHVPGRRRGDPLGHRLGGRPGRRRKTSTPGGEERLARQLEPISYPRGRAAVDDVTVLAQDVPGADDAQIRKLLRRGRPHV